MTRTDKVQQNKNQKRKTIFRCVCLCLCVITFSTKKMKKILPRMQMEIIKMCVHVGSMKVEEKEGGAVGVKK